MICEKCGKEISDNLRFCIHCGAPVVSKEPELDSGWECGSCGAPLTLGDKFCCACGTPVAWDDDYTDPAAAAPVTWEPAGDVSRSEKHRTDRYEEDSEDSDTVTMGGSLYGEPDDDETANIEALIPEEFADEESEFAGAWINRRRYGERDERETGDSGKWAGGDETVSGRSVSYDTVLHDDSEKPGPGLKGDLTGKRPGNPPAGYRKLKHFRKAGDF